MVDRRLANQAFSTSSALAFSSVNFCMGGNADLVSVCTCEQDLFQLAFHEHRTGNFERAICLYREILDSEPSHYQALHFLGMALWELRRDPAAMDLIGRSLDLCPSDAEYWFHCGVILQEQGLLDAAQRAFERTIMLNPQHVDAFSRAGFLSIYLKQPDSVTEGFFRTVQRYRPDDPEAMQRLIDLCAKQERYDEALSLTESFATRYPEMVWGTHRLGCLYGDCGEISKARKFFRKAAEHTKGQLIWRWKHLWYCPVFFEDESQIDAYWSRLQEELDEAISEQVTYDWKTLVYEGFTHSFHLPHHARCCREVLEKFSRLFASSFPFSRPSSTPSPKIRVGFLVTPGHEGGFLRLARGIVEHLDSTRFEVVLIYNETTSHHFDGKFQRNDIVRVPYSWNFEMSVRQIRSAECDIIYYWKVGADVWNFFLPMCRLAPLQCTSWGTHGTSGVDAIDYYVSWDRAETTDAQNHYTETLYLLKTSPLYEPLLTDIPPLASRESLSLPKEGAIYFCPHRMSKYHPCFDRYLKEILEQDSTGYVVLLAGRMDHTTRERLLHRMEKSMGSELFRRVIFLPHQPVSAYYRYLSVATVILNSPIYSGEITTIDGFLYGIPSVTQTGTLLVQRYATAFYDEMNLSELAVVDRETYVQRAVRLGRDVEYRKSISEKILAYRDQFFENTEVIHQWEHFLEDVVRNARYQTE